MDEQVQVDRNVFEKAITDTCDALLKKWGVTSTLPGEVSVSTPKGVISRVGYTYIFKTSFHDWNSLVIGNGYHGDPFKATEILGNVCEYCASEDFIKKVKGSIRVLKAIHKALGS